MQEYIGYIRVSTVKQGTKGVSLPEQRDAISRYSERNHISVGLWLEEMETAAKRGRPIFNRALKLLRQGKFKGIILHKLDRGARNLKDWAEIGELSDHGVEVHFVTESLDLQSRGGRLAADIQAVVASDYIRNLREETRKGFYGRLKQGIYPLQAPLGYKDEGKGKAKTVDPIKGPLVKKAFELYATGKYNFESLGNELCHLGLRNRNGGRVTKNGLTTLLHNPFYIGVIRLWKTDETFLGIHQPLITKPLFDRVQAMLSGRLNVRPQRHAFSFRRLLSCSSCGYSLIGERQKGRVYYRCHNKCPKTSIREDVANAEVSRMFYPFCFNRMEKEYFISRLKTLNLNWIDEKDKELKSLTLQYAQIKERLNRLTDAFLDGALDKSMFEERKANLLFERKSMETSLSILKGNNHSPSHQVEKFLELLGSASLSHQKALSEEKREIVRIVTSNRIVTGKKLDLEPSIPFGEIGKRFAYEGCDPKRDIPRIWDRLLAILTRLNLIGQLPDLSKIFHCRDLGDSINKQN